MSAKSQLILYGARRPQIRSGLYELTLEQTVFIDDKPKDRFVRSQLIEVEGAQYTLPPGTIQSVYPPDGAVGAFGHILPHVVLNDATLPWQRSADPSNDDPDRSPPWLAVLIIPADAAPAVRRVSVNQLRQAAQAPGRHNAPPREVAAAADDQGIIVQVIDLPRRQFVGLAPTAVDLSLTCHVREVTIAAKADSDGVAPPPFYGVVTATCRPVGAERFVAHLVSLEALKEELGKSAADRKALSASETLAKEVVRLVSLHQWSFAISRTDESFVGILKGVVVGMAGAQSGTGEVFVTGDARADRMLQAGYWPLAHLFDDTKLQLSWYRPPLVGALRADPLNGAAPGVFATSARALLAFDPQSGTYDATAAVAWQWGRMIALHHVGFAEAVYRLKLRHAREAAEDQAFQGFIDALTAVETRAQLESVLRTAPKSARAEIEAGDVATPFGSARAVTTGPYTTRDKKDVTALATAINMFAKRRRAAATTAATGVPMSDDEQVIADRLARLALLEDVPLSHLVPDTERYLMPERLSFFRLDPGWIAALIDGALSIGEEPGNASGRKSRAVLARLVQRGLSMLRASFAPEAKLDLTRPDATDALPLITGFLLRSRALAGWPGIEVEGTLADGQRARILRLSRYEPDILLCLFEGQVAQVDLIEPAECVYFAVAEGDRPDEAAVDLAGYIGVSTPCEADTVTLAKKTIHLGNRLGFKIHG